MGLEYIPRYCIAPLRPALGAKAAAAGTRSHCPRGTYGNSRDTYGKMWQAVEDVMRMVLLGLAMVLMAGGAPRAAAGGEVEVLTAGALAMELLEHMTDWQELPG